MSYILCSSCGRSVDENLPLCGGCGKAPFLLDSEGRCWCLESELGVGTFACTWKAREKNTSQLAAVKEVHVSRLDRKQREMLIREAKTLETLRHPCIPALLDSLETGEGRDRRCWLVQSYIPGRTLRQEIGARSFDVEEALETLAGILEVLIYLHELTPPVIHRDIKPENLIRNAENGRWTMVDFGSVRDSLKGSVAGSTVAGTFEYMAPEQFLGEASRASDLWTLGVVGVEILCREPLRRLRIDRQTFNWEPYIFAPAEIKLFLGKLLEVDPAERSHDARAVLAELREIQKAVAGSPKPAPAKPVRVTSPLFSVDIPDIPLSDLPTRKVESLRELRRQREEALRRAAEEARLKDLGRRHREAEVVSERKARTEEEREETTREGRLQREREAARRARVAGAVARSRRQVEPQARKEWENVLEFLREISDDGTRWDETTRRDGLEAVEAWLEAYGCLPQVRVDDELHAVTFSIQSEAHGVAGWLTRQATWEFLASDPRVGERGWVGFEVGFSEVDEEIEVEEQYQERMVLKRILGIPVKTELVHRSRWVIQKRKRNWFGLPGGMALRFCPPGDFLMGSEEERDAPQHPVQISRGFWIGETPVTQGAFRALCGKNPSSLQGDDRFPVTDVTWQEAIQFCNRLSEIHGLESAYQLDGESVIWNSAIGGFRLPTEAEWEYACRAGTLTRFWSGDQESDLESVGWCEANSGRQIHPVGEKLPNPWGLYDVHGNVLEWCQDGYGALGNERQVDPVGPAHGAVRVIRGGSFWDEARWARSACRGWWTPALRSRSQGFRVVLPRPFRG